MYAEQAASVPAAPANQPKSAKINPAILLGIIAVAVICVGIVLALLFRTKDETSVVTQRDWQRTIVLEQFGPVELNDWRSDIPSAGKIGSCQERQRSTSSEPVPGAREVCGTPYTVDEGSGFGKVVQDCVYQVYEDFCSYEINDWSKIDQLVVTGSNNLPSWPAPQLNSDQRLGDRSEVYQITFDSAGKIRTYTTSDAQIYQEASVGSQWILTLNGLGAIVEIQPAN